MTLSASYRWMTMISGQRVEHQAIELTKTTKSNPPGADLEVTDREAIDRNAKCRKKMIVAVETKTVRPFRLLQRAGKFHPGQKLSKGLLLPTPRIINEILEAEDEAEAVVLGSSACFSTADGDFKVGWDHCPGLE